MTPHEFFDLLWRDKPEEHYVLIWTLHDKRSRWFYDVAEAAAYVESVHGKDVYCGVGLAGKDHGPGHRCASGEITGVGAFWADFDIRSAAHPANALPASVPDALSIIPSQTPPTLVIDTGNGAHAWWVLKEPRMFESDEDRREVARLAARWSTMLRLNAGKRGWTFDRLSDLARVMRIPGTINAKDPNDPKPVGVFAATDARYNLCDFEEVLDDLGIPDPESEEQAARRWAERFQDTPLTVDLNARIDEEILDGWMKEDLRFKNTWLRQRHDLKDQSQSGYDLALACFGLDAGLSEQEIVNLIVHHRSLSGRPQRTRVDYFQRTIAKAADRTDSRPATSTVAVSPRRPPDASDATESATEPALDPEAAKVLTCQTVISQAFGVQVLRLVKITGKEPTFYMQLPETKIEFASVGKLITQESVRMAIAGAIGKLIPKIKPKLWEQLAQTMLDACIVEEGSEEMDWEGAAMMYVTDYLSETGFIDVIESQLIQNRRKPMILDGRLAICASDLQVYICKTKFQNLSVKLIGSMLGALGAKHTRIRGPKFKEQSRWVLPPDRFDPADYTRNDDHSGEAAR